MSDSTGNPIQTIKNESKKITKDIPSLNEVVKVSVDRINLLLSKLETNKHDLDQRIGSFTSSRVVPIMNRVNFGIKRVMGFYQRREYYGPQIVAGSAAAVGTIVTLRRGKVPGLFTGGLTGGFAYTGIYGGPKFSGW
jgi:hypothetical protein